MLHSIVSFTLRRPSLFALAVFLLVFSATAFAQGDRIKNPYHAKPAWRVWRLNDDPVAVRGGGFIEPPKGELRSFPRFKGEKTSKVRKFLEALAKRKKDAAGIWDDVYSSRDNGHSYLPEVLVDSQGGALLVRNGMMHGKNLSPSAGLTVSSQSTTGMGHDLVGNGETMRKIERLFYFAGHILAGPAHVSYLDWAQSETDDSYEALVPSIFNSMGSSGSEVNGLAKMIVAGGFLSRDLKKELKKHGAYASTLLYLWKAGLPYDVPYDHELRHRVAYNSRGDHSDYKGPTVTDVAELYHNYDDDKHIMNMAQLAADLQAAPPITVLRVMRNEGGTPVYFLKTAALIKQRKIETITLRVSTADCYDLYGLPLTFRWKVLYGHRGVVIKKVSQDEYEITIPYEPALPRGRTAIALFANNGKSDGNPAIINIFREYGRDNKRPSIEGLGDMSVLPGEKVKIRLNAVDPEGFPVRFSKWAGQVGELDGNLFLWRVPQKNPSGIEKVKIIASDGTGGNSYNAAETEIRVTPIIADIQSDMEKGKVPLGVRFDGSKSRDVKGGILSYRWDFGDGATAEGPQVQHEFTRPGFHIVKLTVEGTSGKDTSQHVVRVDNDWPSVVENGWNVMRLKTEEWSVNATNPPLEIKRGALSTKNVKGFDGGLRIKLKKEVKPPLYVEAAFTKLGFDRALWGFDILGAIIGNPAKRKVRFQRSVEFAAGDKNGYIAHKPRKPWCDIHLRMYVQPLPDNPTLLQYTGYVDSGYGERFFSFTHAAEGGSVSILTGSPVNVLSLRRFIVRSPSGDIPVSKRLPAAKSLCSTYKVK